MGRRFAIWLLALLASACCGIAFALPPLGLTQIGSSSFSANLEVIGPSAYLGVANGVWTVDSAGTTSFVAISHPTLGTPNRTTRVVDGPGGELYVAARFGGIIGGDAALFGLSDPSSPVVTWLEEPDVRGVDMNLRTLGNIGTAAVFHLDGTITPLPIPEGSGAGSLFWTSRSGYGFGHTQIPNALPRAPSLWTPQGEFSFVDEVGFSDSLRDRLDQQGVNIGITGGPGHIQYGGSPLIRVKNQDGGGVSSVRVIISQSEFAVIQSSGVMLPDYFGYYPGAVPGFPDRALPLLEFFPELASVDIDEIYDLAAVDGYIYLTLSGSDGTYLFGARDPSVVPEPATLLLTALGTMLTIAKFASLRSIIPGRG